MAQVQSLKGAYLIENLKNIFKQEKIYEEDLSWEENTQSENFDTEENNSDENLQRSFNHSKSDVSFLAMDMNEDKDQNRMIYQKIADAFMNEHSQIFDLDLNQEQEQKLKKQIKDEYENEFEKDFENNYNQIKNDPCLDVVEMDEFDRIKLYQTHTLFQIIYKKAWYIKTLINYTALKIVQNPVFETFSLLVILFNSITLSLDDPTTNADNSADTDFVLLIIYTIEMCLKIIAFGFIFNKGAYMRDMWNIIDIVIIATGYLPYFVNSSSDINLSALRSLRVLRPLKSVNKVKALKQLLQALFSAIPLLKDSIIILIFFFIIFGIAGLQLFTGQLKSRCVESYYGTYIGDDGPNVFVCASDDDCAQFQTEDMSRLICGKMMISPDYDIIQFDTFGWSVLNVYVVVSLEGWTRIMNLMQEGFSVRNYLILNIFLILAIQILSLTVYIGAFFLMNLTMAIIGVKYTEAIQDQKVKKSIQKNAMDEGYNMKALIEMKVYKSNKIYYQELEEEKKKKHSFFGLSLNLGMLAKSFKSIASAKQSSQNRISQLQISGDVQNPDNKIAKQTSIQPQSLSQLPQLAVINSSQQQLNRPSIIKQESHENPKSNDINENKILKSPQNGGIIITKSPHQGPILQNEGEKIGKKSIAIQNLNGTAGLESAAKATKSYKGRALSKKITKNDGLNIQKKVFLPILSPRNMEHNGLMLSKRISHSSNRNGSQNPINNHQILEGDEEMSPELMKSSQAQNTDQQVSYFEQNLTESHDANHNNLILPHLLVSQLEKINNIGKNNYQIYNQKQCWVMNSKFHDFMDKFINLK